MVKTKKRRPQPNSVIPSRRLPATQRNDARSTKVRDHMRDVAKAIVRAAAFHVENDDWKIRIDQRREAVINQDSWENSLTGFGTSRDKRIFAQFRSGRVVDLEAEDIWRGDDMAARAIETVPNQIVRAGFELHVQGQEEGKNKERERKKKDRLGWLRSAEGTRWWMKKVDDLDLTDEQRGLLRLRVRADLAADVFPEKPVAEARESGKEIAEAMMAQVEDLSMLEQFGEALKAERGFGGAALLPGIRDGVKDLSIPLDEDNIRSIDWLDVVTPLELIPFQWYSDPTEKDFGKPELYWLQRLSAGDIGSVQRVPIHESRLIRFDGIVISKRQLHEHWGWGDSVLNRLMEVLRDFQMSWQGTALLIQDFAQAVVSIEGLADAVATGESQLLQERAKAMDEARSIARAILIDAKEKFERQQTPVTGLAEILDRFMNRLAAAAHMPVTLMFGQAPAGLNATGDADVRAFYDNIDANRERKLRPKLLRLLKLLFLAKEGPTRGQEPEKWTLTFGPLWQPTAKEEADRRLIVAQADRLYIEAGVLIPEEVAISRFGGDKYSAETTLDQAVRDAFDEKAEEEAEAEAKQMQEQLKVQMEAAKSAPPPAAPGKPGAPTPKPAPEEK